MSKDIKKALEHCVEWKCDNCPNRDELGSGEIVCRGRLLPEVLEYVADLEAKLAEKEKQLENAQNLKAIEVADELSLKLSKIHNQDKISFAVEQLEKVKEFVNEIYGEYSASVTTNFIDNQINELKGE